MKLKSNKHHKRNKCRALSLAILAAALLVAAGCGGGGGGEEGAGAGAWPDHDNRFPYQSCVAAGEGGYFYFHYDAEGSYMRFFDPETGVDVKLCGKADCTHDTADCDAYVGGIMPQFIAYVSGGVYYLQNIGGERISLCRMEKDGSGHQEVTTIYDNPGEDYYMPSGFFHRGSLYYVIREADGSGSTETLYRVRAEKGAKPEKQLEVKGNMGYFLADGDDLYFSQCQNDGNSLHDYRVTRMSLGDGGQEDLYVCGEDQMISGMALANGCLYYSVGTEGVIKRDLETGEEEPFGKDLPKYAAIYADGDYIYVDNTTECDMAYAVEGDEDAYDGREILVLGQDGERVAAISMRDNRGLILGADEKNLLCERSTREEPEPALMICDKSQFGSGSAVFKVAKEG